LVGGGVFATEGRVLGAVPGLVGGLVAIVLFFSGLGLDPAKLARQGAQGRAILWVLLTTYGVGPLAGYALALLLRPGGDAEIADHFVEAVVLASAQASTLAAAIALTRAARGNGELAVVLTVVSNLAAVFLTPWILRALLSVGVSFSTVEMTGRMALVVVLPVMIGMGTRMATRRRFPHWPERTRQVPQAIILVFTYLAVASAAGVIEERPGLAVRFLGVALALHAVLVAWSLLGARLLRLDRPTATAVIYAGSQKAVPNGIYLWTTYFGANPLGAVPIVLMQVVQLVTGYLLIPWLGGDRRGAISPSPGRRGPG
jgi:predicted Na+-dependent transporter